MENLYDPQLAPYFRNPSQCFSCNSHSSLRAPCVSADTPSAEGGSATALVADSLLDSQETSVGDPPSGSYRAFLIKGISRQIRLADQIYAALDQLNGSDKLSSFRSCRTDAWFMRHVKTGLIRVSSRKCGLRWCPLCARVRRFLLCSQVSSWLQTLRKPKFFTFTLRHSDAPLADQINRLYKCFRNLRLMLPVKKRLRGGIWFFQITKSQTDGRWHPHLHCLVDSSYFPQSYLSELWLTATGNSDIVDCRAVRDLEKAAHYVARYSSAPADLRYLDLCDSLELVQALHGRRLVGKWGSASVVQLSPVKPDDAHLWEPLFSFKSIYSTLSSESISREVWACWRLNKPCPIESPWSIPPPSVVSLVSDCEPERAYPTTLF